GRGDRAVDGPDHAARAGADRAGDGGATGGSGEPGLDLGLCRAQARDVVLEVVAAVARAAQQRELGRAGGLDAVAAVDQADAHVRHLVTLALDLLGDLRGLLLELVQPGGGGR